MLGYKLQAGLTFSFQIDAAVNGPFRRVIVDDEASIELHVERSVDDGAVIAHDVQTFVGSALPETREAVSLIKTLTSNSLLGPPCPMMHLCFSGVLV